MILVRCNHCKMVDLIGNSRYFYKHANCVITYFPKHVGDWTGFDCGSHEHMIEFEMI